MPSYDESFSLADAIKAIEPRVIGWRRDLHMHPELSLQETRTGEVSRGILDAFGIPSARIEGSESFYAILEGAHPGPAIILRADMDALPIQEISDQTYASVNDGVMHACGHDAHVAMLLGAAAILSDMRDELHGSVIFCFQSAEEVSGGADELLAALRETNLDIRQAAGIHIWSSVPTGEMLIVDGAAMAGLIGFEITMTGQGGHGSRPDMVHDPIKPICDLTLKLSALPSRIISPFDSTSIHIGKVHAGVRPNIFPDTALLHGGARFFTQRTRDKIFVEIKRVMHGVAAEWNVEPTFREIGSLPPVVNDPDAAEFARNVVSQIGGLSLSSDNMPLAGSDNVGFFLQEYPGVYAFLGCGNPDTGAIWEHHNARFDIDESSMILGVEFFCRYALDYLR